MSLTVNGSKASAVGATSVESRPMSNASAALIRADACGRTARTRSRVSKETRKVIKKRQSHQQGQHGHADALADLDNAVGDGTALENLDEIIQQVPSVE